ncbi:hypothetical protein EKO27_g7014 [Xylaria grammica]|uniref:Uncharacterized protein n=1 Tax=Xylaria grammica TaxID=363999 RepID=A0A439D0W7_9PEZI|nr:hypothetical protein EKO27_g7014 [Xylaria grammica]
MPPTNSAPPFSPAVGHPASSVIKKLRFEPVTKAGRKKRNRAKKRKLEALQAGVPDEQGRFPPEKKPMQQPTAIPKPNLVLKSQEKTDLRQLVTEENTIDEELSEQIRLAIMEKKTEELQGYVNQIQDAVTIVANFPRLKKQIAIATAALAPATDEEE